MRSTTFLVESDDWRCSTQVNLDVTDR